MLPRRTPRPVPCHIPRPAPRRGLLATALLAAAAVLSPAALPATAAPVPAPAPAPARHSGDCPEDGGGLGPALTRRLDATVEKVRRAAGIPGIVVGVWLPGKGCYVRATGVADERTGAPMSADTYVRIGSETKTFTVTALLQLVDEGRVGLDDPIDDYVRGVPNGHAVTLRQLAGMRSGLFPYTSDPAFVSDLLNAPERPFEPWEALSYGYRHANTSAPGTAFQYSNSNLVLLGMVVEKVTGRPLAEVLHDRVIRPAGLRHSFLAEDARFPEPHARGYTDQTPTGAVADATDWNPSWAWAAGAMVSNLHDLRRWAPVVATGKLLGPATQAQRMKTLPTGFPGTTYGLGILKTGGWIGHNGSIPGYETVTVYLPSKRATLVLMLNTDSLSGGQEPSTLVARAVTEVITPQNVYAGSVTPRG
ncbi:serine hydrolase domain-containing protein [Streptomyces filamentosus]|uniref:serine hydrolase domain-containing protein n=1 Tax=Streptomyces filamentosus TaxID=67294 RepID=UPI001239B1B6|nr:serine hydrolase domain-containing protein [Streptomyces filamentosus]KAA6218905.1 class A beta-lactamase-related serine hydrolase [Streptomyces filamentosus]